MSNLGVYKSKTPLFLRGVLGTKWFHYHSWPNNGGEVGVDKNYRFANF